MGSNPGGESTPRKRSEDCDGTDAFLGWFWVLQQAAPNIGETEEAPDFAAYAANPASMTSRTTGTSLAAFAHNKLVTSPSGSNRPKNFGSFQRCFLDEDLYV